MEFRFANYLVHMHDISLDRLPAHRTGPNIRVLEMLRARLAAAPMNPVM